MIRMMLDGRRRVGLCLFVCLLVTGSLLACQVPVFRYALERWNPDRYQCVVLTESGLNDAQQDIISSFRKNGSDRRLDVKVVNVSATEDSSLRDIWRKMNNRNEPLLVVKYPLSASIASHQTAHVTPLSKDYAATLEKSPVREELVDNLTAGHSAVWLFVESGDAEKDEAALGRLETQLALDAAWLKLPSPAELEVDPEVLEQAKIKLKVEFSVIRVRRDDPREKFLVDCLLNSESDLHSFDEPMAFPVFGRGRVLYALVGAGIASDTIRAASSFVVGPCSCQVKNQNPGFDLLVSCDWDAAVGDTFISEPLPSGASSPTLLTIPPGRAGK